MRQIVLTDRILQVESIVISSSSEVQEVKQLIFT